MQIPRPAQLPISSNLAFTNLTETKDAATRTAKLLRRFATVYYRRERLRVQAGPADQRAIQLFLSHQSQDVVGFDATAVQNTQGLGLLCGELSLGALAKKAVRRGGNFRRCRLARANSPDWLVSYQNTRELLRGQRTRSASKLRLANLFSPSGFAMFQQFADANDRGEARRERGFRFFRHRIAGFSEELPPLRMPDNHVAASRFRQHRRRDFAGECPFFFPENVLRSDSNIAVLRR